MQTSGPPAGPARTSVQATPNAPASQESEAACFSRLWNWFAKFGHAGSSWKMSRASSRQTTAPRLSRLSTKWKKSGIWVGVDYV